MEVLISTRNSSQLMHCLLRQSQELELMDIDRKSVIGLVKIPNTLTKLTLTNITRSGIDEPEDKVELRDLKDFVYRDWNTSGRLEGIPFEVELLSFTYAYLSGLLDLDILTWESGITSRITNRFYFNSTNGKCISNLNLKKLLARFGDYRNIRQLHYYDTDLDEQTFSKFTNLEYMILSYVNLDKHLEYKINKDFNNLVRDFPNLQYNRNGGSRWELATVGVLREDFTFNSRISDFSTIQRLLVFDNCDFLLDRESIKIRAIVARVKFLLIECWDPRKIVGLISTLTIFREGNGHINNKTLFIRSEFDSKLYSMEMEYREFRGKGNCTETMEKSPVFKKF